MIAANGPTQGKLEAVNAVAILAEFTGRSDRRAGTTTWRPPYVPVTLGRAGRAGLRAGALLPMQPVA